MPKITEQLQTNSAPILVLLLVAASFFIGRLSAQVDALKNGQPTGGAAQQQAQQPQQQAPTVTADQIKGLMGKDLVKFGDPKSKVVFVEVSDPSCPYCHMAAGLNAELYNQQTRFKPVSAGGEYRPPVTEMKKLLDQKKIAYVWVYQNGHGNGEMAAKALYCANEKGKFWEAHNLLYGSEGYKIINDVVKNDKAKSGEMAAFLKKAVDENFMKGCLSGSKYDSRLSADQTVAASLGVNGTPGFFVNTTNYPGAVGFDQMESVVTEALK